MIKKVKSISLIRFKIVITLFESKIKEKKSQFLSKHFHSLILVGK